MHGHDPYLQEQLDYYRARAVEYDQWWLRRGRYDRGSDLNAKWTAEGRIVATALADFRPSGRVLELACGTGIWTEQLARSATTLTAIDGSPEMLAINAARVASPRVTYLEEDIFAWQPDTQFDVVFFGFWLSHVPPDRFDTFWGLIRRCLAPGGRVFFVDSRHDHTSTATDHGLPEPEATTLRRRLNDGREFQIYKVFYDSTMLEARLRALGWHVEIRETDHYFLYGTGQAT